jgi:hypothetical protein
MMFPLPSRQFFKKKGFAMTPDDILNGDDRIQCERLKANISRETCSERCMLAGVVAKYHIHWWNNPSLPKYLNTCRECESGGEK